MAEESYPGVTPMPQNGGPTNSVLADRLSNLESRLNERATAQKQAVDAALIAAKQAVDVALLAQEKAVNAAFAASEKAIAKAEESQKEYNKTIGSLQNDVVRLKESQAQSSGNSGGFKDMYGYVFGFIMAIVTIYMSLHK
jgi:uncharacterized protein YaiL (DUF2058 family)